MLSIWVFIKFPSPPHYRTTICQYWSHSNLPKVKRFWKNLNDKTFKMNLWKWQNQSVCPALLDSYNASFEMFSKAKVKGEHLIVTSVCKANCTINILPSKQKGNSRKEINNFILLNGEKTIYSLFYLHAKGWKKAMDEHKREIWKVSKEYVYKQINDVLG